MSRKIICDRCGTDITGLQQLGFVGMSFRDPESGDLLQENPLQNMDFCPECMDAIRAFISDMPKPEPEPELEPKSEPVVTPEEVAELAAKLEPAEKKKQPGSKTRKKVDTGTISALYKAGWSLQDIAVEMRITVPEVRGYLKKMGVT